MRKIRRGARPIRKIRPREVPIEAPMGVYLPDHLQIVRMIAMRGATDKEIEEAYGLGAGTVKKWRKAYPSLDKAIEAGRTAADGEVLHAMFKTAVGYHETEEQAVGGREPTVLQVRKYFPGQFLAQKHWLANRKREEWPGRDQVEVTGKDGKAIKVESRNDVIDAILTLVASKPDPEKSKTKDERAT